MIEFDIDIKNNTPYLNLLESLVNQSKALRTIHNHKTWCLSALTYALHLNDCLVLFEDLKNRWARELPFGEAWDVDFREWKTEIWSAANNTKSEVAKDWKSLCDNDYKRFIELSQQVAEGEITIMPLVEFVENKETSIQQIIKDAGGKLSELFSEIEHASTHYDDSLFLTFYDECIDTYKEMNKDNLYMVKIRGDRQTYEAWEASKTLAKRPLSIQNLMDNIAKDMNSYKSLSDVWSDCYDTDSKTIDGESIARNLFIYRREIIGNNAVSYRDSMDKLFYTVTMLEFLNERLKELTSSGDQPLTEEQLEQKRKQSNKVFREKINDKDINFGRLIAFFREYVVDTITYKYEWMAIYLFAKNHNLLKEYQLAAFEEQMNMPEWFGSVVDRRNCSADALGDYNFLTNVDKNKLLDDSIIPDGSKASITGRNRIINKYNNLDINFCKEDICD